MFSFQVLFEDIFAEPEGGYSYNSVWNYSRSTFNCSKGCCYKLLSALCAVPYALYWGCHFACVLFNFVWIIRPAVKSFEINLGPVARVWSLMVRTFFDPWFESCERIFSNINMDLTKDK
jgi:caveolin 3